MPETAIEYASKLKGSIGAYCPTCNTPRRKNWYIFKALARRYGGWGKTTSEWKVILLTKTSDPKTNPWDVYHPLYKGAWFDEEGAIGKFIGKAGGLIGAGVGLAVGGVAGAKAGGSIGSSVVGSLAKIGAPTPSTAGMPSAKSLEDAGLVQARAGGCFVATECDPENLDKYYNFRDTKLPEWVVKVYYNLPHKSINEIIRTFSLHRPVRRVLNLIVK